MQRFSPVVALFAICVVSSVASAQTESDDEIAKKLSNPVSDMVSVPLQFNWEFGYGADKDMHEITNLQPVVPFRWNDRVNLITRLIMPVLNTPGETTLGDMTLSFFFSPVGSGTMWGVGPVFGLPRTGEKWSAGPTVVILKQEGRYTYGALANHLWSFAGDEDVPDVNQTYLQPFLAIGFQKAVTLTIQSETVANWEASSGNEWTIPINVIVSKVKSFGPYPASYAFGGGVFVDSPEGGPEWKLRGAVTLILPSKK